MMSRSFTLKTNRGKSQGDYHQTTVVKNKSSFIINDRDLERDPCKSEDFEVLFENCINKISGIVDWKVVQAAVLNQSAAETIVWPTILRLSVRSTSAEFTEDEIGTVQFSKASLLFVLLTTWEYREGNAINAFAFIKKSDDNEEQNAWGNLCNDIFCSKQNIADAYNKLDLFDFYSIQTMKVHFMTICWTICQTYYNNQILDTSKEWFCKPLLLHIGGIKIWKIIPEHVRVLELKKKPQRIQRIWQQTQQDSNDNKEIPFIVNVIQNILSFMENHLSGRQNIAPLASKRDFDSMNENSTTSRCKSKDGKEIVISDDGLHTSGSDPTLQSIYSSASIVWTLCHRGLELLIDLLYSPSAFVRTSVISFLMSIQWTVRSRRFVEKNNPNIVSQSNQQLLLTIQLVRRLQQSIDFPIRSEWQQKQLVEYFVGVDSIEQRSIYFSRSAMVQKISFRYFSDKLPDVIFAGVGLLCNASFARNAFDVLSDLEFLDLLHMLRLIDKHDPRIDTQDREFLKDILGNFLVVPSDLVDELQSFPLYPTEIDLWNFLQIPAGHSSLSMSPVLSLPKLQTRFLTFTDYLLRNFELVRCESSFEIRHDITDAIRRLQPVERQVFGSDIGFTRKDACEDSSIATEFTGWARMALELETSVTIKHVRKQLLGEKDFSLVLAEFSIDLAPCGEKIRREWDDLGLHDVLFLVAVDARRATVQSTTTVDDFFMKRGINPRIGFDLGHGSQRLADEDDETFPDRFGVTAVRGCKIVQIRDECDKLLTAPTSSGSVMGTKRYFTVELDTTQYSLDFKSGQMVYQSLNIVVRRHGKSNNFHSVLDTIRGLLKGSGSIARVIPCWLQPMLLGHGNSIAASNMQDTCRTVPRTDTVTIDDDFLDYADTFLDEEHIKSSFRDSGTVIIHENKSSGLDKNDSSHLNYRLRRLKDAEHDATTVEAISYRCGRKSHGNNTRFTPKQVEAITSGLSPGLTLVVGPPGTGKSDTAVQIIACLYHSFPSQRTVVVTHSNAALNDIFEKLILRGDIEERFLLRLGSGERSLNSDSCHDFTKLGRVAYSLERRKLLLEQVQMLAESIGYSTSVERGKDGSSAFTCQSAEVFYQLYVKKLVHDFQMMTVRGTQYVSQDIACEGFPFMRFFGIRDKVLNLAEADAFITEVSRIFEELAEYRPFELLRSHKRRSEYLISKQSRVVAMTCTHAAIARAQLLELGFEYDNLIVEEAGQMLEIETFIPLLLQRGETDATTGGTRLKRLCLMGDPNQLPPVIQNSAFAKFSNLDQSMFVRLIRLGVPYILLDMQGRSRPEIANLYNWRYHSLKNMDHVSTSREFVCSNTGMVQSFQLINVDDYDGQGETSPSPFFYQNLGEAEYIVALFQYLVLIGHPPEKISILTTYNGQKDLISDVISHRCGPDTPLAGCSPFAVATVDQYQGQQNNVILLSLVRTKSVGHFRDIRRLVVAVSRARLGLYVFCRQELFCSCHELKPTIDHFLLKPTKLQLLLGESYPTERKQSTAVATAEIYEVQDVMHMGNIVHKMQRDLLEYEED